MYLPTAAFPPKFFANSDYLVCENDIYVIKNNNKAKVIFFIIVGLEIDYSPFQ